MIAEKTRYFKDFEDYYVRASILNRRNAKLLSENTQTEDDLQNVIPIYDTVWRSWAGFSKMLEDAWKGPIGIHAGKKKLPRPYKDLLDLEAWLYVFLVHRITGSGASFERDHGYRNTVLVPLFNNIDQLNLFDNFDTNEVNTMADFVFNYMKGAPIFTSIGNQIPPFNKPKAPYSRGGEMYLHLEAPKFVNKLSEYLTSAPKQVGIKKMTDWILDWHKSNGMKQYNFVLSAFAMDIAEYFPEYVDQQSHVYLGKNAEASLEYIFRKTGKGSKDLFQDHCMEQLMKFAETDPAGPNTPYSIEDVLCDFIRYVKNYIPKQYAREGLNPKRLPILLDEVL